MKDNERKLYFEVLTSWGIQAQIDMAIEECAELINALCKLRRGRCNEADVITEIADVQIMCDQLALHFDEDNVAAMRDFKINRLKRRLEDWKKQDGV